jgi:hypothetical protein
MQLMLNIYINKLVKTLEQSAAHGLTLLESEVKCLLFSDDLVLLSRTKEDQQQHLDLLHRFCQTWALTVNQSNTKIMVFQKRTSRQNHKIQIPSRHCCSRAHKKQYIPWPKISATGNFQKAVNDLRDKARRAFYAIKRNIKFDIPIRTWLKILESIIEPIAIYCCEVWALLTNQ